MNHYYAIKIYRVLNSAFKLQLQGVKWIKTKYGEDLVILRLDHSDCMDKLENAIKNGKVVLIENMPEQIEPTLDPLIGKNLINRGS